MQPFDVKGAGQENSANSLVVKPVSGKDGPLYGAIERIEGLINSVVVRTRSVSSSCFDRSGELDVLPTCALGKAIFRQR